MRTVFPYAFSIFAQLIKLYDINNYHIKESSISSTLIQIENDSVGSGLFAGFIRSSLEKWHIVVIFTRNIENCTTRLNCCYHKPKN